MTRMNRRTNGGCVFRSTWLESRKSILAPDTATQSSNALYVCGKVDFSSKLFRGNHANETENRAVLFFCRYYSYSVRHDVPAACGLRPGRGGNQTPRQRT